MTVARRAAVRDALRNWLSQPPGISIDEVAPEVRLVKDRGNELTQPLELLNLCAAQ
jgi:hypothetical protein